MANYQSFQSMTNYIPVTIPVGETDSNAINICGTDIIGFYIPAGLTAASISFESADQAQDVNNSTFAPLYDDAQALVSVAIPDSLPAQIGIAPSILPSLTVLKIVANTAQLTADAIIYLITRPV